MITAQVIDNEKHVHVSIEGDIEEIDNEIIAILATALEEHKPEEVLELYENAKEYNQIVSKER